MAFFTLLKKPKSPPCSRKRDACRNRQNNVKSQQHDAWMDIINSGYGNSKKINTYKHHNIRTCIYHFHPSVINCNDNNNS